MKIIQSSLKEILKQVDSRTSSVANKPEVETAVSNIINDVAKNGDEAIRKYEKKFDRIDLDQLKVPQETIDQAFQNADSQLINALKLAKENITTYHSNEIEHGFIDANQKGVLRGQKLMPLERVGLYVPGGTAACRLSILNSNERNSCKISWGERNYNGNPTAI